MGSRPGAEERAGESQGGQEEEQVVFGDPQLDVLACGGHLPLLDRGHGLLGGQVGPGAAVEQSTSVDPRAEVGRDRHVRGRRHDPSGESPRIPTRSPRSRPNPSCVDILDPWGTARTSGTARRGGSCRRPVRAVNGT